MVSMQKKRFALAASILLSQSHSSSAFAPSSTSIILPAKSTPLRFSTTRHNSKSLSEEEDKHASKTMLKIGEVVRPAVLTLASAVTLALLPGKAIASAPVTPIRNFKPPDTKAIALQKISENQNKLKMQEEMAHQIKCDDIEREQGLEARQAYEAAYQKEKVQEAELRALNRKKLQYALIDMGICPFVDVEGERQMYLFDYGIDLNKVPSSAQQKEMMSLKRDKQWPIRREKERFVIKCIIEDIKLRGEDPLRYLEANKAQTSEIINLKDKQLDAVVARYKRLLQTQGSLSGIKADVPFNPEAAVAALVMKSDEVTSTEAQKVAAKADAKAAKALKKAEEKRLKAEAKAKKKEKKNLAKVEEQKSEDELSVIDNDDYNDIIEKEVEEQFDAIIPSSNRKPSTGMQQIISEVPLLPIVGVVGVTGSGILFKSIQEKRAAKEKEREKQFKLLMGMDSESDNEEDDGEDDEPFLETKKPQEKSKPSVETPRAKQTQTPTEVSKKKRKSFSVFSKKGGRETDLSVLVSPDATHSEFSSLLAKLLTFGAPGRFPMVLQLDDGMPIESFDLEKAKALLSESRSKTGMSDEDAAEAFACVVNCMIIDIIDLASSSLSIKEKKSTAIVNALNIVMDFMDHAASLFDAVAENVSITPVTYSGDLSKSKLEEMFTIYATSLMTSMDGSVTQDRIDTIQQVFNINDKKAEGLVQKGMMKNLMKMMKDGPEGMEGMEGMEGLSEMMASMAGAGNGIPGFEEGDVSPEQLKQSVAMMKELIGSGSISKEEITLVREQFKQMYGSDISELIKAADEEGGADELGKDGQELLQLFKDILKEE